MAITFLEEYFPEEGAGGVRVNFTDTNGTAVAPNTLTWSLLDPNGNILNSREDVTITPAASVVIILTGDDLAFLAGESGNALRFLLLKGTYHSSTLGNDVPLRAQCGLYISDFVGVES